MVWYGGVRLKCERDMRVGGGKQGEEQMLLYRCNCTGEEPTTCDFIHCILGHIHREKRCGDDPQRSKAAPSPPERMRQRARRLERDGHRMGACVQTQALSCLRLQKQRILVAGA